MAKEWVISEEDLGCDGAYLSYEEVIRCGDCKWFQCNMNRDGTLPNGVPEYECRHWCGECDPVDFCSYAERRTDNA